RKPNTSPRFTSNETSSTALSSLEAAGAPFALRAPRILNVLDSPRTVIMASAGGSAAAGAGAGSARLGGGSLMLFPLVASAAEAVLGFDDTLLPLGLSLRRQRLAPVARDLQRALHHRQAPSEHGRQLRDLGDLAQHDGPLAHAEHEQLFPRLQL